MEELAKNPDIIPLRERVKNTPTKTPQLSQSTEKKIEQIKSQEAKEEEQKSNQRAEGGGQKSVKKFSTAADYFENSDDGLDGGIDSNRIASLEQVGPVNYNKKRISPGYTRIPISSEERPVKVQKVADGQKIMNPISKSPKG